jgi:transcription elongation factor Elf1
VKRSFSVKREVRETGRTRWIFDCPFCGAETTAFLWSLAARGKRCTCGALHSMTGTEPPATKTAR